MAPRGLFLFAEPVGDQFRQRVEHGLRVGTGGGDGIEEPLAAPSVKLP